MKNRILYLGKDVHGMVNALGIQDREAFSTNKKCDICNEYSDKLNITTKLPSLKYAQSGKTENQLYRLWMMENQKKAFRLVCPSCKCKNMINKRWGNSLEF
ncbi:MAG: hypothetical protein KDC82_07110 [Bacteroidetes bacterium]|nr:hypothetical protein [Bacteroidota bacterium]